MFTVDVIGRIEANESGEEAPAAKKSTSEGSHLGGASRTIESPPSESG